MIVVKRATEADFPAICEMGAAFLRAHPMGPWTEEMLPHLAHVIQSTGLLLMATADGYPAGFFAAVKSTALFDPDSPMWQEIALWVNPAFRGQGVGDVMLRTYETEVGDTPALMALLPESGMSDEYLGNHGWHLHQTVYARNMG